MRTPNKKPGAELTAEQRRIHRRIEAQSDHSQNPPKLWHPAEYPELYSLVRAAVAAAQARRRLRGRIVFNHEGRRYAARLTSLDRVVVEDWLTGRFFASSAVFAI